MPRLVIQPDTRLRADAVGLILVVACSLGAWTLSSKNIWLDEAVSWHMATSSPAALVAATAKDIHPPLYYLALKGWVRLFGDSLAGLRSLSLISTLVALWLMGRLAKGLPNVVTYAALLWFAVSPHTVHYEQEARMYAAVTAAVLAACVSYRRWVASECRSRIALTSYAASAAAALYLHYFAAFAIAAIWMHLILLSSGRYSEVGRPQRRAWKHWLVAHAAIGLAYAPWATTAVTQIARGQPWRPAIAAAQLPHYAAVFAGTFLFDDHQVPSSHSLTAVFVLLVFGTGLGVIVARAIRSRRAEQEAFFALAVFVPMAIGLALLPHAGYLDLSRYLAYSTPLLIVAVALGLSRLPIRPAYIAGVLLLGSACSVKPLAAYYDEPTKDYDAGPIVAYVSAAAHAGPGHTQDSVVVAPGYLINVVQYLSRGTLACQRADSNADLSSALTAGESSGRPAWLIVDYRWPGFAALAKDPDLEEQPVPLNTPSDIRLYRTRSR